MRTTVSLTAEQATLARRLVTTETNIRKATFVRAEVLTALNDSGVSVRDLVTVAKDLAIADLGKTRIAVLVKAYREAGENPTLATFEASLKATTDANREAGKAAREARKAEAGEATEGEASPTGDTSTRPATVKDGIRLLWELVSAFGYSPEFAAALVAAAEFAEADAKQAA